MPIHHDRRRRVLTDDLSSSSNAVPVPSSVGEAVKATKEAYAAAARREQQPHITDLVPITWLALALPLLAAATVVVGLELAYTWLPELTMALGATGLDALDLASSTSLAHWYSAALLGLGAMLSVLIYRLRSHRIDDYRGRYRMWLWVVPTALGLSLNETSHLDQLGESVLRFFMRGSSLEAGSVWTIACAVVWGLVAVRVLIEVRHSLLASIVLLLAAGDLLCVATVHLWPPTDLSAPRAVMLLSGLRMAGHLLLLAGTTLFARHVILDAEGRLKKRREKGAKPPKRKRRAASNESETADAGKKTARPAIDSPHKTPGPPNHRTDLETAPRPTATARLNAARPELPAERKTASPQRPAADEDDDNDDATDGRGMTRAERKRLRRQQR
jgi:hypothetical protein